MIQQLINRCKRMRTEHYLNHTYQCQYAFVGMGQHSLTNLYPVLHYLQVPLKYICVTNERKARLIERKFKGIIATTRLDDILSDEEVKGVLVAASPKAHFTIASLILQSSKSLFIEKPPCQSTAQLQELINLQETYGSRVAMVGLQKRYAPAIQMLKRRLKNETLLNYDLHYLTGAYPEGDALLDLYIHPIDIATWLFGPGEILVCQKVNNNSYILMIRHPHIVGTLELSTSYTWSDAKESLKICTSKGIYRLSQMDVLTYEQLLSTVLGLPIEKVRSHNKTIEYLCVRNNFTPTLSHNQIYTQGYFNEIYSFIEAVEGRGNNNVVTCLKSVRNTYQLLSELSDKSIRMHNS